ncbi:MAG: hypothetical protein ACOY33_13845 [Pseudomonadota bacterium]
MRTLSRLLAGLLLLTPALPAVALTKAEEARLVTVNGDQFTALVGTELRRFALLTVREGRLRAVPLQFVERTGDGFPYFATDESATGAGNATLLDATDQLVFQLEDTGPRFQGRSMQKLYAEIEVMTSDGPRYVYLADPGFLQNNRALTKYDDVAGLIGTDWYELEVDPKNLNIWRDFFFRTYTATEGKRKRTLLDTMKVKLSSGVFTQNNRITLDNRNLDTEVLEIRRGQVQTEIFAKAKVEVARVPVLTVTMYYVIQPRQTEIYARFKIPTVARAVLEKPAVSMAIDGNRLEGGRLWTSWGFDEPVITDGRLDSTEAALLARPVPKDRNWLLYDTTQGFMVLAGMEFKRGFDIPMSLVYRDSRREEDLPERFIGQWPNVGFSLDDVPIGHEFFFKATLAFNDGMGKMTPREYAANFLAPLSVKVRTAAK